MSRFKGLLLLLGTFLPSSLRLFVWRRLGFSIDKGCRVSPLSIVVADHIEMGPGAVIEPFVFIYRPRRLVMGERSRLAGFVRIIGHGQVEFAQQTFVALACLIDCTTAFYLGARSALGPRGIYYTHGASTLLFNMHFRQRTGPIRIGQDCWISMAVVVYPDITIGDRVLIFPGLVINSNIEADKAVLPPETSYRTVPAAFLRTASEEERFAQIEKALRLYALEHPGSKLQPADEGNWVLELPRRRRIILARKSIANGNDFPREETVVWQCDGTAEEATIPTFDFERLKVHGGHSAFATALATFLCERCGIHFVFEATKQVPDPA